MDVDGSLLEGMSRVFESDVKAVVYVRAHDEIDRAPSVERGRALEGPLIGIGEAGVYSGKRLATEGHDEIHVRLTFVLKAMTCG